MFWQLIDRVVSPCYLMPLYEIGREKNGYLATTHTVFHTDSWCISSQRFLGEFEANQYDGGDDPPSWVLST